MGLVEWLVWLTNNSGDRTPFGDTSQTFSLIGKRHEGKQD